jgi:hypothetical protein
MKKGQYQLLIGIIVLVSVAVSVGIIYYFSFKPNIETNQTTTTTNSKRTSTTTSSISSLTTSTTVSTTQSVSTTSITTSSTSISTTQTSISTSSTTSTTTAVSFCSDGTAYGQCSSTKPKYCSNGNLLSKCSVCNCPTNYVCQNDDTCKLANSPLIGATVHTFYVPSYPFHWQWYQNSSTYWEYNFRQPSLGFYDQTQGTNIQDNDYSQLKQAKVDYALISWFGGINNDGINSVTDKYWSEFTHLNDQGGIPINISILVEFGGQNYQTRLDYVKTNYYDKYPKYVLHYNNQSLIALSLTGSDPNTANSAISYAQNLGFYVISDLNVSAGGAAFTGETMKFDDPNRIGNFAADVSPSVDVTGENLALTGKMLTWEVENLAVNQNCGQIIFDSSASNNSAVHSTSTNCYVFDGPYTPNVPTTARYLTEWYVIFRLETSNPSTLHATLYVKNNSGYVYVSKSIDSSLVQNTQYVHIPVQFSYLGSSGNVETPVFITSGDITIDKIWITTDQFRKPSTSEYDSQWQPIYNLAPNQRPKFITIASFNAWEEGSAIEKDNYFGDLFINRTFYWVDLIRNTI